MYTLTAVPVQAEDKKETLTQQQNQAQQNYEEAQTKLEELQNQQQQTESQITQMEGQAAQITAQLQTVYISMQEAERQVLQCQADAEEAARALEQKQTEYNDSLTRSQGHLRAMQLLDGGGSVSLLTQAQNLYQLLTFTEVLQQIASKSNEILTELSQEAPRWKNPARPLKQPASRQKKPKQSWSASSRP